jgi:hypothetical protein
MPFAIQTVLALRLVAGFHGDVVVDHCRLQLPQRDRVAVVRVQLLEDVPLLFRCERRVDRFKKLLEMLELQAGILLIPVVFE